MAYSTQPVDGGRPESRPILMVHDLGGPCTSATCRGTLRVMDSLPPPLAFVVLLFAGWVNRQQQAVNDSLLEKNRSSAFSARTSAAPCVGAPSASAVAQRAWPRRRPQHDQSDSQGPRDRAAPDRGANMSWKTFLATHWDAWHRGTSCVGRRTWAEICRATPSSPTATATIVS